MSRPPRLVLDTNVIVSAILWGGKPGQFLALAGEGDVRLYTSRLLLDELRQTLERPKFSKAVAATGLTIDQIIADYRRLCILARPRPLEKAVSRDPDDDHVLAAALAARADVLVTGDDDLLVLDELEGVVIRSVAETLGKMS
jgi:putative PIN family toxin of toxin-antitoxin system